MFRQIARFDHRSIMSSSTPSSSLSSQSVGALLLAAAGGAVAGGIVVALWARSKQPAQQQQQQQQPQPPPPPQPQPRPTKDTHQPAAAAPAATAEDTTTTPGAPVFKTPRHGHFGMISDLALQASLPFELKPTSYVHEHGEPGLASAFSSSNLRKMVQHHMSTTVVSGLERDQATFQDVADIILEMGYTGQTSVYEWTLFVLHNQHWHFAHAHTPSPLHGAATCLAASCETPSRGSPLTMWTFCFAPPLAAL